MKPMSTRVLPVSLASTAPMVVMATMALTAPAALADGDRRAGTPLLPAYVQECGSCHVAFPPELLGAASWQRLMDGLARHFGSDASVDAQTARTLSAWLQAHAGSGQRAAVAPPEDRITQGAWFRREHREVSARCGPPAGGRMPATSAGPSAVSTRPGAPATTQAPRTASASDCAACHTRAAEGRYGEREVRLPR